MPHWSWGLSTALILTLVIWLNGRKVRSGWLLGATVQLLNIVFGWWIHGQWTFLFLAMPMGMFLWNWWDQRETARQPVPHPAHCVSRLGGIHCDRVEGHDGTFHVGFSPGEPGKFTMTRVWTDKEAD